MFGCLPTGRPERRLGRVVEQVLPQSAAAEANANVDAVHTSQAHGFGDLPWHILRVLMSHVVEHANVDTVRTSRLVCRSWRDALSANITAAILRPLTKQSLDIDGKNRPIINYEVEGMRAPMRAEYLSLTESVLESGYSIHIPEPEPVPAFHPVSVNQAEADQAEADAHWADLQKSKCSPWPHTPVNHLPRSDSLGHYPCEASDVAASDAGASDAGDSLSSSGLSDDDLHIPDEVDGMLVTLPRSQSPVPFLGAPACRPVPLHALRHSGTSLPHATPTHQPDEDAMPSQARTASLTRLRSMEVSSEAPKALSAQSSQRRVTSSRQLSRSGRPIWLPSMPRRHTTDASSQSLSQRLQSDGAAGSESSHQAQSAAGPGVVVVANQELDEYTLHLRQQYGLAGDGHSGGLPAVVLRVGDVTDGASAAPPSCAGSLSTLLPGGGSPPPSGRSPGAAGASPESSGGGGRLPFRNFWSRSRSITGAGAAAEEEIQPGDGDGGSSGELNEHEHSVVQALTPPGSVEAAKLGAARGVVACAIDSGASSSAAAGDLDLEISAVMPAAVPDDEGCGRYPLPRCMMMRRPTSAPASTRARRNLIISDLPVRRPAFVDLAPLATLASLRTLALLRPVYGVDPAALAAMTGLTNLSICLQRRDRLGLACKLRFLPPPGSQEGLWAAVAALPLLRRLNLSYSHTVTPEHIALLTSLTALESLDLTGVHLPLSALAPMQCLTSVTQLRIPNVKTVSEAFLQLIGERRTVPRLAELIAAMPQLRHLDLFWQGPGDNQSIMKDPKYMRTLARATHLRRLDIAKIAQVTDRTIELLSPLTAVTALKLGCNAWDLYPLTGRSFVMFRRWRGLRVLHLEACRNLQKDAFIAIAAACPQLECLHLDTASRITPSAFALAYLMPALSVLELVELVQVPDAAVVEVCAQLLKLRPGMAAHIIALKRCGGHNLTKFGEKIPGSLFRKVIS